jgi:hypothetical protein
LDAAPTARRSAAPTISAEGTDDLGHGVARPMGLTGGVDAARGRVVNVGSIAALANLPVMPSYLISMAAAASLVTSKSPAEVFMAINNTRRWWDGDLTGTTDPLDAEFTYQYGEHHASVQRVTELVPGERVVWESHLKQAGLRRGTRALDLDADQLRHQTHRRRTKVTLVHHGLRPMLECYDARPAGWEHAAGRSLRAFIETVTASGSDVSPSCGSRQSDADRLPTPTAVPGRQRRTVIHEICARAELRDRRALGWGNYVSLYG